MQRSAVVGVFGGGRAPEAVQSTARSLGEAIAQRGWILLNGGRDAGVMRASAEGASQAGGLVVGILPTAGSDDEDATVADGVDVAVFTDMGEARNNVNVLSSDVSVVLPGGAGTLSEAALAVKTNTPLVLLGWEQRSIAEPIDEVAARATTVSEAIALVAEQLASPGGRLRG